VKTDASELAKFNLDWVAV